MFSSIALRRFTAIVFLLSAVIGAAKFGSVTQAATGALLARESFESASGDYGFTLSGSATGFLSRLNNDGSNVPGPPTNANGTFIVGSNQTTQGSGVGVTMDSVTISGKVNTSIGVRLAAPGGLAYDSFDYVVVEASIDSGAFSPLAVFESTAGGFNTTLSLQEPTPTSRADNSAAGDGAGNTFLGANFQDFEYPIPSGNTVQVRVRWQGNSGGEYIAVDDIRVFGDTAATNPPVLGGVPGAALSYTEGDGAVAIASAITATDSDSNITGATVAITGNYQASEDALIYTPTNGVTVVSNVGGVLTLTGDRPASDYQAALRTVQYQNTNTTNPNLADRIITFTTSDGSNNSNQPTRTVDIIDTFLTNSLPYQEDFETDGSGSRYEVVGGFDSSPAEAYFTRITDADTRFPAMANESGTTYFASEQITPGNGQSGGASSVIAQLNAAGVSSLKLDILLGAPNNNQYDSTDFIAVSYQFDNTGPFIELIDFHSTAFNGELREDTTGNGVGDGTALTATFQNFNISIPDTGSLLKVRVDVLTNGGTEEIAFDNIRVTGVVVGTPPVLSGTDAGPIVYTEGDGTVQLTSAATIVDSDSTLMSSATVQITSNYVNGEDVLSIAGALPGGITSAFDAPSGKLTLTAAPTASIADFQTALTQVRYENSNVTNPSEATRTATFRVIDDTTAGSNATALNVQVTDVVQTHTLPFQESFETDGRGTRYRVDGFFDNTVDEFFTSVLLNRTSTALTNADGTMSFAADHTGNDGQPLHAVTFNLDTSNHYSLMLDILLAAPGTDDYDAADFLLIEHSSDGGSFQRITSFESAGGGFNTTLSEDTNNDGNGDGIVLTSAFQNFNYSLPNAATTVIRISVPSTATAVDEEYAFDNVRVTGTPLALSASVDGSNNLVITESGGNTNDDLTISIDATKVTIVDANNILGDGGISGATGDGTGTLTIPLSSFSGSIIINTLGGDDTLTVNLDTNFARAIMFNGGGQTTGDALVLTGGGTFTDATFGFTNNSDGSIDITGNQTITYTGLEPITSNFNATNATLNYSTIAETITVSDVGGGQTKIDSDLGGESVIFNNPTGTLQINAGNTGVNTISVGALVASYPASLEINGGDGGDTVNLNGAITFAANKSLDVDASVINLPNATSDISASGTGAVTLTAAGNIAMATGSSVGGASTTGPITLVADLLQLDGSLESDGTLILRPFSSSTTIGIGGGAGTLNIDDNELANLTNGFSSITIGKSDAGNITVDTATFLDPLTLITGGDIINATNAGTDLTATTITFDGNVSPFGTGAGTFGVSGNTSFANGSSFEVNLTGSTTSGPHDQLNVTGSTTLGTGVDLTLDLSGYTTHEAGVITIIADTGGLTGAFNGLAQGAQTNPGGANNFLIGYTSSATLTAANPTSADLADFSAAADENATLAWETLNESGLSGFHIWRGNANAAESRLTGTLIGAAGGLTGQSYTWQDAIALGWGQRVYYWLEAVTADGSSFTGPVEVWGIGKLFLPMAAR